MEINDLLYLTNSHSSSDQSGARLQIQREFVFQTGTTSIFVVCLSNTIFNGIGMMLSFASEEFL